MLFQNIWKNRKQIIAIGAAIAVTLMLWRVWRVWSSEQTRESFWEDARANPHGDEVLRNLYRQIHNLEAMGRIEIAQNNDHPGGNHGISKERLILEQIALENSRLKSLARRDIAMRRIPVQVRDKPPLGYDFDDCYYNDCQLKMDHNERILGIPSAPGSTHSYYTNRPYKTSRIPAEMQEAHHKHLV